MGNREKIVEAINEYTLTRLPQGCISCGLVSRKIVSEIDMLKKDMIANFHQIMKEEILLKGCFYTMLFNDGLSSVYGKTDNGEASKIIREALKDEDFCKEMETIMQELMKMRQANE